MKIADEILYEISYRSHMSEIRIMNSYNIFTWVPTPNLVLLVSELPEDRALAHARLVSSTRSPLYNRRRPRRRFSNFPLYRVI